MKILLFIILTYLLPITCNSQADHKFIFVKDGNSSLYSVTPTFDQSIRNDMRNNYNKGAANILDENYINNLFSNIIKSAIPENKANLLHFGTKCGVVFNIKGEIKFVTFYIKELDIKTLADSDLYNLYNRFMQIRIDTSKVTITQISNDLPDYTEIFGPLKFKQYEQIEKN
jgi:hypothetical protein